MTMLEHRARLNEAISQDNAKRNPKRAEWHREQAAFLRKQDKQKAKQTERTW
jgi:hypothetical protein